MLHIEFYRVGTPYVCPSLSKTYTDTDYILSFVRATLVTFENSIVSIFSLVIDESGIMLPDICDIPSICPLLENYIPGGKYILSTVQRVYTALLEISPELSWVNILYPDNGLSISKIHFYEISIV